MRSKMVFFLGWLGTSAFLTFWMQTFLAVLACCICPFILFDHWSHAICHHHFGLSTIQWYSTEGNEHYMAYTRWRPIVTFTLLSAFYLCAFLPYALPDRIWRLPRIRWIWTSFFFVLGVALGIYGSLKYFNGFPSHD